jgi:hypothetical protein
VGVLSVAPGTRTENTGNIVFPNAASPLRMVYGKLHKLRSVGELRWLQSDRGSPIIRRLELFKKLGKQSAPWASSLAIDSAPGSGARIGLRIPLAAPAPVPASADQVTG